MKAGSESEICLADGKFFRREITTYDLGRQDAMLATLMPESNAMLPYLMNLGGMTVHALASRNSLVLVTAVPSIPFKTEFELIDRIVMQPCFYPKPGSVLINDPWSLPKDFPGKILFAVKMSLVQGRFYYQNAFQWVWSQGDLWYLSYPNNFNDGRLCMGAQFDNSTTLPAFKAKPANEVFMAAFLSFQESGMNDHLVNDHTYHIFRRNAETDQWMNPEGGLARRLVKCSPAFMQGFTLLA